MQLQLGFGPAPLAVVVLGSGSGGNAAVVEQGGFRLLVDAGFSCRELERRMRRTGIAPETIGALVITHEHGDHVRGALRFARRHAVPVWATAGTRDGSWLGALPPGQLRELRSGVPVEVGRFVLEPFSIPHDAREPVGLVIEGEGGRRVGLAADLGSCSRLAWGRLANVDILLLETNHDLEMLRNGPYPWPLKQRIAGGHGHLSNAAAAEGLPELLSSRLAWVLLYHLSRTNNLPALALAAVEERLAAEGCATRVALTNQFHPSERVAVE